MAFFNRYNVVRRDLKPDNLLWNERKEPFICDFGSVDIYWCERKRHDKTNEFTKSFRSFEGTENRNERPTFQEVLRQFMQWKNFKIEIWGKKNQRKKLKRKEIIIKIQYIPFKMIC